MYDVIFSLGGVEVSEASDMVSDAGVAYDVEQCSCGTGYTGLSCEVWCSSIISQQQNSRTSVSGICI